MNDSVNPTFWTWLYFNGSIIAVACLAVATIWLTTRSNISAMVTAAGRALSNHDAQRAAPLALTSSFVTTASARMRVAEDAFLLRVERRFRGEAVMEEARQSLGACIQALIDGGLDPDDVVSEAVEVGDAESTIAVACVLARGADRTQGLVAAALSAGYREDKARRRETFSLDDARDHLGRRAVERSRANAETLRSALALSAEFELIGAELETEADDETGSVVTMKARSTWRLAA